MSIIVYPLKQTSLNIKHPDGGLLSQNGSLWPEDGFTFRMLASNQVTKDQSKAWSPPVQINPEQAA
jgi:hypothetical protein